MSMKELIEQRNKKVHDAREILGRKDLTAADKANADTLLDEAGALDAKIEDAKRDARLSTFETRMSETAPRQTASTEPGREMPRRTQPIAEALTVQVGKHSLTFAPGTRGHALASADYASGFAHYLRGTHNARGGVESLGLIAGDNSKGGYLVPSSMLSMLIKFLDDAVTMRGLATVLPPTDAKSVGCPSYDTDLADADWTPEVPASDLSEDGAARFGKRELTPHECTKLVKASRKLLASSTINAESFLADRIGYKFALTENKAFLTGSGVNQPLGVFTVGTASTGGITTGRDVTASSATTFTGDDLINLLYSLKGPYQARATFLMSRTGLKVARKLKDGNGAYIWQAGLQGQPGSILDRPYVMDENVPATFTTGLYVAMVADFSHYWIQDGPGLSIQRLDELLALKNQVGFIGRKDVDGMPVLEEAFARLKLGA